MYMVYVSIYMSKMHAGKYTMTLQPNGQWSQSIKNPWVLLLLTFSIFSYTHAHCVLQKVIGGIIAMQRLARSSTKSSTSTTDE